MESLLPIHCCFKRAGTVSESDVSYYKCVSLVKLTVHLFLGLIEIRDDAIVLGQCPQYGNFIGAMVDVSILLIFYTTLCGKSLHLSQLMVLIIIKQIHVTVFFSKIILDAADNNVGDDDCDNVDDDDHDNIINKNLKYLGVK